ncbi:MAG: hypothetical protein ACI9DC_005179 [Gammaproteobacteria bacterium]
MIGSASVEVAINQSFQGAVISVDPSISVIEGLYGFDNSFVIPTLAVAAPYFGPNFQFVTTAVSGPATLALLGLGFGFKRKSA